MNVECSTPFGFCQIGVMLAFFTIYICKLYAVTSYIRVVWTVLKLLKK